MTVRTRRTAIAATAVATITLLSACTGTGAAPSSGSSPAAQPHAPAASASATPATLTCDNMIPAATVKAFTAAGWTPQEGPFFVGDTRLSGGMQCTWGTEDTASDLFGWAPISSRQAAAAEKALLAQGWHAVAGTKNVTITAGKDMIVDPDAEGYGTTYEFGRGWVKIASTKQGLLLVDGPH